MNEDNVSFESFNLEEIAKQMKKLMPVGNDTPFDTETRHMKADTLLCDALRLLGQNLLVDLFQQVDKWYA